MILARLSATPARLTRTTLIQSAAAIPTVQKRNVSIKTLRTRLVAIKNIKKITSSMKLVAAARLKKGEDILNQAREFSTPIINFWPESKQEVPHSALYMYVPITSDRGLCGSVNNAIVREVRNLVNKRVSEGSTNLLIMPFGGKGRTGLERHFGKYYNFAILELQKPKRIGFKQASKAAEILLAAKFDAGEIFYNQFKNMVSYVTTSVPIQPLSVAISDTTAIQPYELEGGDDILQNFYEFKLATRLYRFLCEMTMSELSSRMTAMTNASKSAGEMIDSLSMIINRKRQSKITTELIEIISGASAAESQES